MDVLGEFKERWLYEIRKQLKTDTACGMRMEFEVFFFKKGRKLKRKKRKTTNLVLEEL